jgi:ATP-dependent DNA helicase RecG
MIGVEEALGRVRTGRRDAHFDWVAGDASVESLAAALAALANTRQGGTLVIGVSPVPPIVVQGVADPAEAIDRVLQAALSLTPPLRMPMPVVVRGRAKTAPPVVVAQVPAGMPYVYAHDGRYLVRQMQGGAPHSVPLEPRALRRLLIERGEITFEAEAARGATLNDLDADKVKAYAARMGADDDAYAFLHRRGCLLRADDGADAGDYSPTHAGLLLFGRDLAGLMRGVEITAVRFAGEAMSDNFSRQDITGALPDQIRRAETFLRDHLRLGVELQDSMARREQYEYPLEAARELVVNAVAHRDYSIQGDGIRLYLFKDRMEITSPGLLPGPVTVDNIRDERFSRNPVIVQVLADLGFIERLGYGVDRVIDLMRQGGLRAPEFSETAGGFKAVLYNAHAAPPAPTGASSAYTPLGSFRGVPLNPRQETALYWLTQGGSARLTNSELQRLHPDVHPETIRRDLSDLVAKHILVKLGEKRGSYYVLKPEDESAGG